jgi:hypothetical protein
MSSGFGATLEKRKKKIVGETDKEGNGDEHGDDAKERVTNTIAIR